MRENKDCGTKKEKKRSGTIAAKQVSPCFFVCRVLILNLSWKGCKPLLSVCELY